MKKFWIVVKDNLGKTVAMFEGGLTFQAAVKACDGNYPCRGVKIVGPMTLEEAKKE